MDMPRTQPAEEVVRTTKKTTYFLDGNRRKIIYHTHWEGRIHDPETGELIRDDAVWTDVEYREGNRLVRSVLTGVVWRLVIPGHGIVVHQSGRSVYTPDEDPIETPFAAAPDLEETLCRYV
jgi:hypothetical protein